MITRRLPCQLGEADILDRGKKLANAEADYARLEREKKENADQFKRSMEATGGRIDELSLAIRERVEIRDIECVIMDNHSHLKHEVVRTDTGEIIESYPFTEAERQGSLI